MDLCSSNLRCSRSTTYRIRKNFTLEHMVLERSVQCSLSTPGGCSTERGELHTPDRRRLDADPKHPPSTTRSLTMKIQSMPVHQYFFRILKHKYQESQVQFLVQVLFSVLPTRMMRSSQMICLKTESYTVALPSHTYSSY